MVLSGALASNNPWAAGLFVAGLVAIFSGLLTHMARLNLGLPAADLSPQRSSGWILTAMLLVTAPLLIFGWWLPAPLFDLAQRAVTDITGGAIQ
jgi:hypothetical protein